MPGRNPKKFSEPQDREKLGKIKRAILLKQPICLKRAQKREKTKEKPASQNLKETQQQLASQIIEENHFGVACHNF